MRNTSNEDKGCQSGDYTDLSSTYKIKMICLPAIAITTAFQSIGDSNVLELDALFLGALLYLVGISFDFFISAKSNHGPKLKYGNFVRKCCFILYWLS